MARGGGNTARPRPGPAGTSLPGLARLALAVLATACAGSDPATDPVAPWLSIQSPASGSTVSGLLAVAGTASGASQVDLRVDGGPFQPASGVATWSASLDTLTLSDGSHALTARATGASGRTATATVTVNVANASPPGDPSVSVANPAARATLQGTVAVRGTAAAGAGIARVEVQVDSGAWAVATGTSPWSAAIPSAAWANGSHAIAARVTDLAGALATATVPVVFANPLPGPLAVAIQSPRTAETLSGRVTVTGSATGATRIQVRTDALAWLDVPLLGEWSYTFDSAALAGGAHSLAARVQDAAGNAATDTIAFATSNPDGPPAVAILSPADGATVSGLVLVRAYAHDLLGASQVQLSVDGGPFGFGEYLDAAALPDGPHTITARASDAAGNAAAASVTVQVAAADRVKPGVRITSPAPGSSVSGLATLAGTASDEVGVARVELVDGGGSRLASGTSSWTLALDTRTLANGGQDLTIRAVDTSGNVATAGIALTVANPRALERFVSPEGVVVDVDSAGGWSAAGIYQMLRESARDLDVIGPGLRVVVQDTGATAYTGSASTTEGRCRQGAQTIWFNGLSGASALHPERALAHEYGHAWSRYWLCEAQQLDWSAYLAARGTASDPRLDSSYPTWSRDEMIAEDYRAAFGSPMALERESGFTNGHLPFDPSLPDFLAGVWSRR